MVRAPLRLRILMKASSRTTHSASLRKCSRWALVFPSVAWCSMSLLSALPSMFDWPARRKTLTVSVAFKMGAPTATAMLKMLNSLMGESFALIATGGNSQI